MTPADMAAIHGAAFSHSRPWSKAEFADLMQQPTCISIGTSACFALVRVVLDEAELLTIATHPQHRRQGLARACMAEWQAIARDKGAARALLEVAADNEAAVALYRSCGFETCGTRRGYYRRDNAIPVDALMMDRTLP